MVECTTATGWQVMRMAWSAPRELVNCSPADTSLSSDCRAMGGGGGGDDDEMKMEGEWGWGG